MRAWLTMSASLMVRHLTISILERRPVPAGAWISGTMTREKPSLAASMTRLSMWLAGRSSPPSPGFMFLLVASSILKGQEASLGSCRVSLFASINSAAPLLVNSIRLILLGPARPFHAFEGAYWHACWTRFGILASQRYREGH